MRLKRALISAFALLSCFAGVASADTIDSLRFDKLRFDTSSLTGIVGSLDFQFNPGAFQTQEAAVDVLMFSSDGTLAGSPALFGNVSGALPSTVTFGNGSFFNDYFEGFTFGSFLSFDLRFYGPAITSPDGSPSGSIFALSMFSDPGGTVPALTRDPNGFAFTVDVNPDGTTSLTNSSPETKVPEPTSLALLGTGIGLLMFRLGWRRRAGRPPEYFFDNETSS